MADADLQTPDDSAAPYSYITPIGYSNSSDCGYCRRSRSGYSYYAAAKSLEPSFYQKLIDRCWRRSGALLYRPNQKNSCCPHYTLRLDSTNFKASKDQRQAVNRFNRHVLGETYTFQAARLYPRSREEVRRRHNEFDLVERIHEPETEFLKTPPVPAHQFSVTLEPDTFTEEKYDVFENYQRIVHQELPHKISRPGFENFLCNSPLRRGTLVGPDGAERQVGSYHQCYRLDGKLVAVGVLDLLPDCVSAVYFLYDESIHFLNPGKLGAMREIALAREGGYKWWYSGYYVHKCAKMKYKMDFSPQYVLDPETLDWDRLDKETLKIFDKKDYVSLSRERKLAAAAAGVDNETNDNTNTAKETPSDDKVNDDDDDEEEVSLLETDMPGIPSLEQMKEVHMDGVLLRSDSSDNFFLTADLVIWEEEDIAEHGTLKSRIAELVAAIGPDLIPEICIDFRRKKNRRP